MGETFAEVTLISNSKQLKKRLCVDTGATYSWISADTLKKLGVKPIGIREFVTIEGKHIPKSIGEVLVECFSRRIHTVVVFATKKDSEVLGLHALEGLALEVDPINQKLKKSRAIKALTVRQIEKIPLNPPFKKGERRRK
ncbi:MAG: aspartyl protease family protein [Elusimicrobia bacterium]|nr:aspartyl protease family protein [Elusimicrobiota bacterium]